MQRALSMLEAGEAYTLVAVKLDRLSRSVIDFTGLLTLASSKVGRSSCSTSDWT